MFEDMCLYILQERVEKILKAGANVVLTTGGIDDLCLKYFVEAGAVAVRRCKKSDLKVRSQLSLSLHHHSSRTCSQWSLLKTYEKLWCSYSEIILVHFSLAVSPTGCGALLHISRCSSLTELNGVCPINTLSCKSLKVLVRMMHAISWATCNLTDNNYPVNL